MNAEVAGGRGTFGAARFLKGLVLAAAWVVLAGCSRSPDLLLLLDPYTQAIMTEQGHVPLRGIIGSNGSSAGEPGGRASESQGDAGRAGGGRAARFRVEVIAPGEGSTEAARRRIAALSPRGVYVSPLLAADAIALSAEFPDAVFFLDGPLPAAARGENLRILRYDFAAAYGEAAASLRTLLSMPELPQTLRAVVPREGGPVVGIVSLSPDKSAQRELQVFREALSAGEAPVAVEYRELDSLEDRARVRRSIERLREQGVGVFLLRTSTLTGFCLEVLQKEGGLAIVESAAGIEAYADVLLLTLERDFPSALVEMKAQAAAGQAAAGQAAAGQAAAGQAAGALAEAGSVRVPVRLRWWGLPQKEVDNDE